jgi:hypothetical protein
VPLSRRGTLWSYTENRYAPPPPYPAPDPFEPFAVAAVQLADEGLIVLGKVVEGTLAADLRVGIEMELTTMPLFTDDDGVERIVYAWAVSPDSPAESLSAATSGCSRRQHRPQAGRIARAGDDAERSDEEERRTTPAGDDAERSDEEERRS